MNKLTEDQREQIKSSVHEWHNEVMNMAWLLDRIEQIVSDRLIIKPYHEHGNSVASDRTEPGESGQSAEDVLKGMYGNNTQYGYSFNSTIEAMRLHAAQVCADKDREIDARVEHWDKYYKSCLSMCSRLTDENKHLKSELDRLNESLTVIVRKNAELEKEVKEAYDKGVSVGRRDI